MDLQHLCGSHVALSDSKDLPKSGKAPEVRVVTT